MASRGVNKVILVGNLGQDPEVRYMPNGKAVANISLATSESWKDQQGQLQERTEWHRCSAYERLAEVIGEYLRKGSKIYLEGKLHTREWQDQQGQKRYTTEIVIQEMQMLDSKPANQQGGTTNQRPAGGQWNNQGHGQHPAQGQQMSAPSSAPQGSQAAPQGGYSNARIQPMAQPQYPVNAGGYNEPPMDFDDDIPFNHVPL